MACMPRQTPRSGTRRSAATWIVATDTPAVPGLPGPGETTIPRSSWPGSAAIASIPSRVMPSLRITRTSAPAAWSAWTRLKVKLS